MADVFCFVPHVHERYLLFAAGVSCVCAGISTGMMLLGILLSLVTTVMTLHAMLAGASWANVRLLGVSLNDQFPALFDKKGGQLLLQIATGTSPDLGFAVLLIGFIFLYFALARRRCDKVSQDVVTASAMTTEKSEKLRSPDAEALQAGHGMISTDVSAGASVFIAG